MKQSLGLLEVSGLALAISCADVMAKAASITLVGLEKNSRLRLDGDQNHR
ncbi:propanediol utilization polyhedral bodies protein [Salmonella enterica subsp. arizonae]|nr:propanediol utilization polyhedral bodies protein [Salmonella enterica subsp. arizonae]